MNTEIYYFTQYFIIGLERRNKMAFPRAERRIDTDTEKKTPDKLLSIYQRMRRKCDYCIEKTRKKIEYCEINKHENSQLALRI
jgi:hypothetical protein